MGINGLLPLLKSIHKPCTLRKFEGKTIGVDAYGWLHRGTVSCSIELATGNPTKKFVNFAMHRVRMLQHFGVIPFLIFDGDYLPSKAATESDREKRREASRRAGLELLNAGKTSQAHLELQKAVDVTPAMARQLIDELKKHGIQYIVAPYEADAQMVYLERKGIIDGILSEDSDLLVFGAKCLLTKLDQYGNCIEINKADFSACKEVTLTGWTDIEFRQMAILSGCDYLANINNMGLKTAYRMLRRHKTIEKVLRMLSFDGKYRVPKDYLQDFYRAEVTFLHQRVFCPKTLRLVFHTEPATPIAEGQMPFIGAYVDPEIAQGVARGDLDPMTKLPIVVDQCNNKMAPATPWAAVSKAQPQQLTPCDSKKGKPIDTFFKPKRIPLAELDINCFTPSPTQQDTLRRNSGPWLATPAPRPYLNRAIAEPHQPPQSAPAPSTITRRTHRRTSTISEPRPPKRARLCEETELDLPTPCNAAGLGRSRFFGEATTEPSPSINTKAKGRRSMDVTIFSDDSIDEALLSLPDFDGFAAKTGSKIHIFEENVKGKASSQGEVSQVPVATAASHDSTSHIKTPALTPSVSAMSSDEERPSTPSETTTLLTGGNKLLEKFSYAPIHTPGPKSTVNAHDQQTPLSSAAPKRSKIPLAVKSLVPTPTSSLISRRSNLTPLQRLGATAVNRSKLPMTPLTPSIRISSKASLLRRSMLSKGKVPFPEVARDNELNDPVALPLPAADEAENVALSMPPGSEDMIIPDSESEGEDMNATDYQVAPRIGLGRFVCSTTSKLR